MGSFLRYVGYSRGAISAFDPFFCLYICTMFCASCGLRGVNVSYLIDICFFEENRTVVSFRFKFKLI